MNKSTPFQRGFLFALRRVRACLLLAKLGPSEPFASISNGLKHAFELRR